ncbi:MAG: hypothetical protein O7D30_04650, partial [Rickettsia endosymbiont of Ixodes persulcatus]|nr:hypothetical protein [Rickettsia endosymbiont of Ixodes persulcatus]
MLSVIVINILLSSRCLGYKGTYICGVSSSLYTLAAPFSTPGVCYIFAPFPLLLGEPVCLRYVSYSFFSR